MEKLQANTKEPLQLLGEISDYSPSNLKTNSSNIQPQDHSFQYLSITSLLLIHFLNLNMYGLFNVKRIVETSNYLLNTNLWKTLQANTN